MASNAFSGVGAQFQRASVMSSQGESFVAISEINSISGPNKTRAVIDVTSLDSTGGYREFIGGFRDGGEVTLEMNFTPSGFDQMNDDFESDSSRDYKIVLPNTEATEFLFTALVTDLGMAVPMDDKVTANVTLKVTGQVTMTT